MKKFLTVLVVLMLTLSLVACGGGDTEEPAEDVEDNGEAVEEQDQDEEAKTLTVSTKFVDDEQTAISLKNVVEAVNERSEGSLELQLHTGGTLPIGKDGMEQINRGSDWIMVDGVNFLGDYEPDYNAVTGPFLYENFDEYFAMTDSDIVQDLNTKMEEDHNIKVLSLDWVFGFRSMMTNTPIETPEDMDGLNIRVPTSQLYTYTIEEMGGTPVSMPYPDTYAAIQQGVIDGVEGSIQTYYGTKQYENVKEYSLTNHLLGVSAVTIPADLWEGLSDNQRTILEEEFQKGMEENLEETKRQEDEYAELLQEEEGVTFHEVDVQAFREATAPVFEKFDQWTPGIYDEILEELERIKENQ